VSLVVLSSVLVGISTRPGAGVLCLATDFPTEDRYLSIKPLQNAVHLAVAQNLRLGNGETLQVIDYDDTSRETLDADAQIGARNVQHMVRTPCIVGMIGPENSGVAAAEMPIAANAGLVMISPGNTLSGLTVRPYAALEGWDFDQLHPKGKPLTYFRIAPNDVAQGLAAADFVFDDLGARTVYVIDDREQFGEDVVGSFTQTFEVRGGKIAGIESITSANPADVAAVATRIANTHPDAVFYSGISDGGGLLKRQLVSQGYAGAFVGGEGIAGDPGFVEVAGGDAANGTVAINPSAYVTSSSSDAAARFIRDYQARYPGQNPGPDAAETYDATMILITAIKQLILAGQGVTRQAMIEQVRHMQYAGVIGPISFDANGDIDHGVFSLYRVQDGAWVYFQQVRV
jgi:branched-chain amino acid transport system substrate-binding protein